MMQTVHLNPEEAVVAALDVRAERVLAVHWGTFDLTDEAPAEPPARLHREVARRGLDAERFRTPPLGETQEW
jgi:N-acyl-phosphatidylethanolamine-hydrolysing phospholipase D